MPETQTAIPTLTVTEKIAVQVLVDRFNAAKKQVQETQQVFQCVTEEIATSHPGYHLNADTFELEADAPAAPAVDPAVEDESEAK
jgi:hypothetical protein